MAVSASPYGQIPYYLGIGGLDFTTVQFNMALFTSSYVPNLGFDTSYDSIAAHEVSHVSYSTGGLPLTNTTWSYEPEKKAAVFTGSPTNPGPMSITLRYLVVYKNAVSDTLLVGLIDLGADIALNNEEIPVTFQGGAVRIYALAL